MPSDARRAWSVDHPWARVYDAIADHDRLGRAVWKIGLGADLGLLHRTTARELATLPPGAAALDVPCGGGVTLRDVPTDADLRFVAADISPAMLRRTADEAARRGIEIEAVLEDVQDLTFGDDTFDLVLAFTSLHCFPDPEQALNELTRVLRPGGRIVGSTMLRGGPRLGNGGLRGRLGWIGGSAMGVLGPGCTVEELGQWLDRSCTDVRLTASGGITYFSATAQPPFRPHPSQ
ncbi:class I SAM-dependent methyltransferase [Aeromicrobium sp. CF3.5]|uniref:class I SAM-dependent methyltransferase n=1 Tax=Aeromicrobium sp. CF3.5 TaxID=3373078 RepID=UPI003EE7284D